MYMFNKGAVIVHMYTYLTHAYMHTYAHIRMYTPNIFTCACDRADAPVFVIREED